MYKTAWNETILGLAVFASACLSIAFTRAPASIALFWSAGAVAAAALIRLREVRWPLATAAVMVALLAANLVVAQRPWHAAALFTGVNLAEIAMSVALFRKVWRFPYPDITIDQAAIMTALFGVAIPGLAALAGGLALHAELGVPFGDGALQWWSAHTIGACLVGPPLILFSTKGFAKLVRPRFLAENLFILLSGVTCCYLVIRHVRFPFVSIGLLLLIAAFRMGGLGASLMSLCLGLIITGLWIVGIRPIGLSAAATDTDSLLGFPMIALLATVLPPIAVGLGSDARRAGVRALRVSERRFRASMEHSPIGMLIASLDGVWDYSNLALQEMLGYTGQELRAMPPGGPSKPDDWKDSESRWKKLLSGATEFYETTRCFQHKNGHWIWAQVAVSLLRDDAGRPASLIAQIESLEARRHAEERIAAERERLKITLQSISDAVITTDARTCITYINAAAESLFGLSLQAVENRRVDEVIHLMDPESAKAAANLLGQSALHGRALRRERACVLHRPDGTVCYVKDTVSPVLDAAGLLTGLVIVFHDATADVDEARDMQHRALHDPLTGLSNRADFEKRLRMAFEKSRHLNRTAAVVAIDLDRFKAVNDAAGHVAGDAVLCKVAEVCRLTVRSSDTVARLGGDEFALILDNCSEERASHIGEKLLEALNPLQIEWGGTRYSVGASVGLAMNGEMPDEKAWLKTADDVCYLAKREGRGRLRFAATACATLPR